jgi:aspartate/methionine/tyrosine aminotransferase
MKLPPFLLDHWLMAHQHASPPIPYNLASSTGPAWTLGDLMALGGDGAREELDKVRLSYAPPQGGKLLREKIADFYGVDPDWVIVTTGASEALSMLFCMVSELNASVVLPSPAFPAKLVMAQAWALTVRSYTLDRKAGFTQTADQVLGCIDKMTRLVLVNTPHNPTGSVMAELETARLAASLGEHGIPLVVDEIYHPLYFGTQNPSAAKLANAIVVGDFSKTLSLSGLRIGWIIDRDPLRRERLIDLRGYFAISGSPLTEAIAAHALAHRDAIFLRLNEVARANLVLLSRFMHDHRDMIGWVPPRGGTVGFPWLLDKSNARGLCQALAREGVLMAPGDCFDAPEHFRVGFGTQASGFQEALEIASRIFAVTWQDPSRREYRSGS